MMKRAFIHSIWEMWVEVYDNEFVLRAIKYQTKLFGKNPRASASDRGGYRAENVLGVKKIGAKTCGWPPGTNPVVGKHSGGPEADRKEGTS